MLKYTFPKINLIILPSIFLFIFISSTSCNYPISVHISGTWTKLREFQWLVPVDAEKRFKCFVFSENSGKYEGRLVDVNNQNDMLFYFMINSNEKDKLGRLWQIECIVCMPVFIQNLLKNLDYQVIKLILL